MSFHSLTLLADEAVFGQLQLLFLSSQVATTPDLTDVFGSLLNFLEIGTPSSLKEVLKQHRKWMNR